MIREFIHSRQKLPATLASLILGPIFMLGPLALGIVLAAFSKGSITSLLLLPILAAGSAFVVYHMFQNFHWVELDGDIIRGKKFWTRQYVERPIADISQIIPCGSTAKTIETVITDKLLGPVRGYEIRFKSRGPSIYLVRHDMTHVDELIAILISRTTKSS